MPNKIALVEDDQELARMMRAFLSSEGFEVSWADNGLDGAALLKENPDLYLRVKPYILQ